MLTLTLSNKGGVRMLDKKKIGKKLKELRISRGLKQSQVSDKVGLSRATISNVEVGNRGLSLESLQKFCELYNVSIDYFGIETKSYNEAVDLTERLKLIFESNDVPVSAKEELYTDIMKMYIKMKEAENN